MVLVIVTFMSMGFIEPLQKKKKNVNEALGKKQLKEIKEGFAYILKSERLKALILCAALIVALLSILSNYYVSLLEELEISSVIIAIVSAVATYICAYASKKQDAFHNKFRNKTLTMIAMMLSISTMIAGTCGIKAQNYIILLAIIIMMNFMHGLGKGMYYTIIDNYLRSFTNEKIDTKIFAAKNLFTSIARVIIGLFASFLLDKIRTAYCMIITGIIFTIIYILMEKYMKTRVGLKPEEYSKEERKYDEEEKGTC